MPPIPITFSEDATRLISSTERRQTDLVEFQIPRLRLCKGPLSLQQNLAGELREDIDAFAQQVEALDMLVGDQKGEKTRVALRRIVDGLQASLLQLRTDYRTALLTSKRTIDSQSKSQREELLASIAVTKKQNGNEKVTDDALMKANDDVTEALRRTIGLMQEELERSVLSSQMLDASTASLRSTSSTHDTLTSVMGTSKQLITALEKSDWLDRVLIISAFMFFVLVILFILKQRILDRGVRMAFWWTRFIPDFSGDAELLQMEKGSAVLSSSTFTASITSASVVISSTLSTISTFVAATVTSTPLNVLPASNEGSPIESAVDDSGTSIPTITSSEDTIPTVESSSDPKRTPENIVHIEL